MLNWILSVTRDFRSPSYQASFTRFGFFTIFENIVGKWLHFHFHKSHLSLLMSMSMWLITTHSVVGPWTVAGVGVGLTVVTGLKHQGLGCLVYTNDFDFVRSGSVVEFLVLN